MAKNLSKRVAVYLQKKYKSKINYDARAVISNFLNNSEFATFYSNLPEYKNRKKNPANYKALIREKNALTVDKVLKSLNSTRGKTKTLMGFTYQKTHRLKKAADEHARKLKARGATVKRDKVPGGHKITYTF